MQCIVFEMLSYNLYEFIKANNYKGISLNLIRRFASQLLQCLHLLQKSAIIHCDLKPENILLKHPNRSAIKVIDFGSSCFEDEKIYNYIQSRFYRAPEIILGIAYTMAIDMWSFGCILAELYIGSPLFPGQNEAEQLAMIMEVRGVPPDEVLAMATRSEKFFKGNKPVLFPDARGRIRRPGSLSLREKLRGADEVFVGFVERRPYLGCMDWNPRTRMTPKEAVGHPWIAESLLRQFVSVG